MNKMNANNNLNDHIIPQRHAYYFFVLIYFEYAFCEEKIFSCTSPGTGTI